MKGFIPFGDFKPDLPLIKQVGDTQASNVIPVKGGYRYRGVVALMDVSTAIDAAVRGVGAFSYSNAGTLYLYTGSAAKLWGWNNASDFTNVSKVGGYSTASTEVWRWADYSRNYKLIATNYADAVQSITPGGAVFADMITSTNKPKARHVAVLGNFVVLGNTNDTTDGVRLSRVWWSAFGDETDFDPDSATQCDYEDLGTGGPVQGIIGGNEYAVIFQSHRVRMMRYIGGGTVFEFPAINYLAGTLTANSIASTQGRIFYIDEHYRFVMLDGLNPVQIGEGVIDRLLQADIHVAAQGQPGGGAQGDMWRVSVLIDPRISCVLWAIPSQGPATPDKVYCYNFETNKWATWPLTVEAFFAIPRITDNDGSVNFFDASHRWSEISSLPLTGPMTVSTSDIQIQPGRRWEISRIKPVVDLGDIAGDANCQISVAAKMKPSDKTSFTTITSATMPDGTIPVRTAGNYMRILCSLSASYSYSASEDFGFTNFPTIQGLEIEYEIEGEM